VSRQDPLPATHRLVLEPDFANSSRFHSAPFQRQPVNRSTGPRFHCAAFHRLKSSKTGGPGAMRAKDLQSPSADKSRIRTFTKLPPSRRPQNQSGLCRPCKPLALRPPRSHPGDGPRLTRPSDARTARPRAPSRSPAKRKSSASAWHRECFPQPSHNTCLLSVAAPLPGHPASHPVSGSPPSGMKAPTRPRGLSPTRANMSRRPGNRSKQGVVRKTGAGEFFRAPDPRPRRPRSPGTSRCTPCATPNAPRLRKVSGGGGDHSAALHYGQIGCASAGLPKFPFGIRWRSDCYAGGKPTHGLN